jgi:peptidoglycan/xylan/chitin deacetylase (PgdA/CDA1 family)
VVKADQKRALKCGFIAGKAGGRHTSSGGAKTVSYLRTGRSRDWSMALLNDARPDSSLLRDRIMRLIASIFGLISLSLVALGLIFSQKLVSAGSTVSNTRAAPSAQNDLARSLPAQVGLIGQATAPGAQAAGTEAIPPAPAPAQAAPRAPATNSSTQGNAQAKPAATASNIPPCDKPGGMGLARIVEIDTTGGPGFGFEHFKQYDILRDKEIVLTFDDGPWPQNTPAVLKALADECLKATFFEIGKYATWHPEITKQVIEAGMTVGAHTWSHKDLARNPYAKNLDQAEEEIEMGNSAVHMAAGRAPVAPFFRFPDLQHPPQLLAYLGERNIAIFSTDIDSRDFKMHKPDDVIKSVMSQLDKRGKGIILMHDFQHNTAEALPELLRQLKAGGYKVVHMVPKGQLTTLPKYDEMVSHQDNLSSNNTRPEKSIVRTIGE